MPQLDLFGTDKDRGAAGATEPEPAAPPPALPHLEITRAGRIACPRKEELGKLCPACSDAARRWRAFWRGLKWKAAAAFAAAARNVENAEGLVKTLAANGWPTAEATAVLAEGRAIVAALGEHGRDPAVRLVSAGGNVYQVIRYEPRQLATKKDGTPGRWVWRVAEVVCDELFGKPIRAQLAQRIHNLTRIDFNGMGNCTLSRKERIVFGIEHLTTELDWRPAETVPEDYYAL